MLVSKEGSVIQVASADIFFDGDVMQSRKAVQITGSNGKLRRSLQGTTGAAIQTSQYAGVQQSLSSTMPIESLIQLNYLYVENADGGELALKVTGVARIPVPFSILGSVVNILTAAGTVVLDGNDMTFQSDLEPVFETAGFTVRNATGDGRRRLLEDGNTVNGLFHGEVPPPPAPPPVDYSTSDVWKVQGATSKQQAKLKTQRLKKLVEDLVGGAGCGTD